MKFTAEQIQAAYDTLPEDIKTLLSSDEVLASIQRIAKKYGLQIDEMGRLEEGVTFLALGLMSPSEFSSLMTEVVVGNRATASALIQEVNDGIFMPIRELLMTRENERASAVPGSVDRDELLDAIENPTPSEHPISLAQRPAADRASSIPTANDVAREFVAGKLSENVSLPSKQTVVKDVPPAKSTTPDPYREPIS
ncbi:MAG: hypothetical protein WC767_03810 [Candidatus Paceibacterota bacterium]|jgi:hypothetical protein